MKNIAWRQRFILFFFLWLIYSSCYADTLYFRGRILHFFDHPELTQKQENYQYIDDGLLVVKDGKVEQVGEWQKLKYQIRSEENVIWYTNGLILPGFIDTHLHYPQVDMIAAPSSGHLLQWLEKYTFPFEKKLSNTQYARDVSEFFLNELLRNGTTTAFIFATRYPQAIDALFEAAEKKRMRIITGKVVADRNLPTFLIESPEQAYVESTQLIKKWHQKPATRLLYAITLRFPPTTSIKMFQTLEKLKSEHPSVYIHSHIAENKQETTWSNQLFHSKDYLNIYDRFHLLGTNTLLAHGIYLSQHELNRMKQTNTAIAFCPTSNLFLGSGLFNYSRAQNTGVAVGLGTDIGAGTSFSLLQTLNEAYKVSILQNQKFSALTGFYLLTLGGAKALHLDDKLGNFTRGKEADSVVLNYTGATPLLHRRLANASSLEEKLFVLMTLGDDRSILATYVNGKLAYVQKKS